MPRPGKMAVSGMKRQTWQLEFGTDRLSKTFSLSSRKSLWSRLFIHSASKICSRKKKSQNARPSREDGEAKPFQMVFTFIISTLALNSLQIMRLSREIGRTETSGNESSRLLKKRLHTLTGVRDPPHSKPKKRYCRRVLDNNVFFLGGGETFWPFPSSWLRDREHTVGTLKPNEGSEISANNELYHGQNQKETAGKAH